MSTHERSHTKAPRERAWVVEVLLLAAGYGLFLGVMLREALRAVAGG